jgi:hypothetical protein
MVLTITYRSSNKKTAGCIDPLASARTGVSGEQARPEDLSGLVVEAAGTDSPSGDY